MRTILVFGVAALIAASPAPAADAAKVLTKGEVAAAIGDAIKDVKVEDATIARYYAVNGKPFQEAAIVSVQNASSGTFEAALGNARRTKYYKNDVAGRRPQAGLGEAGARRVEDTRRPRPAQSSHPTAARQR